MQFFVSTSPGTTSWLVNGMLPSSSQPAPQAGVPNFSWPDEIGVPATTWVSFQ